MSAQCQPTFQPGASGPAGETRIAIVAGRGGGGAGPEREAAPRRRLRPTTTTQIQYQAHQNLFDKHLDAHQKDRRRLRPGPHDGMRTGEAPG